MRIKTYIGLMLLVGAAVLFRVAASGTTASADDFSDREKLMGSWLPEAGDATAHWTFIHQGDSVKITQMENGNKIAEFSCSTDGKNCDVKGAAKKTTVSLWYNGAKLVVLETKGTDVLERKFTPSDDSLEVELIPMVPSGKTETVKFKRAPVESAKK
jgi:hypothetical protein